jgi:hypothetical protein
MTGLTLDAGALIGFERGDRNVVTLLARAIAHGMGIAVPAGVVAQVWRDGRRQARLARLLGADGVEVVVLDDLGARAAGQLCGVSSTRDVVDASAILCARARVHRIATSDRADLARLDASVELIVV